MFHNGSYALCDDALHINGNMSNINTVPCDSQDQPAIAFHNAERGALAHGGPGQADTRGESSSADQAAGFHPSRFSLEPRGPEFLFSLKPLLEVFDV